MSQVAAEENAKTAANPLAAAKTDPDAPGWRGLFKKSSFRDYGLMIALVIIMLFFEISTGGVLFRPGNLTNLILQNSFIVVMSLGMLLVIVSGHIDLSVGSTVGFVGALAGILVVKNDVDPALAMLLCLIVGGVLGATQGYFVAYLKIPSFIVTLAGMLVFRGLTFAIVQGASIGPFPKSFQLLSTGFIPNFAGSWTSVLIAIVISAAFIAISLRRRMVQQSHGVQVEDIALFAARNGFLALVLIAFAYQMGSSNGLPNVLIVMFVLVMLYRFITNKTTIGRRIYALGGNIKAARLSGIKTELLTFLTFANMGILAGLGGLIVTARLNSATAKGGDSLELDVIAACFIGGASASGGVGKVTGAVIGAFIMGVMNNGMSIHGIGSDYQKVIKGLVLLGAVCLDVYNKNKAS